LISELGIHEEQVFGLDVAVDDIHSMAVGEGFQGALHDDRGVGFGEGSLILEPVKQFPALEILQHKMNPQLVFMHLIQLHHPWMVQLFQYADLVPQHLLHFTVHFQLRLVYRLDCIQLRATVTHSDVHLFMSHPLYLSKTSHTQQSADTITCIHVHAHTHLQQFAHPHVLFCFIVTPERPA
jgi:hypothetical protein